MPQTLTLEPFVFALNLDSCKEADVADACKDIIDPNSRAWVHFRASAHGAEEQLLRWKIVPEELVEIILSPISRPGVLERRDGVLISLRGRNLIEGEEDTDLVSVRFWMSESNLVSAERRNVASIRETQKDLLTNRGKAEGIEVFEDVAERLNTKLLDLLEELSEVVDQLETESFENESASRDFSARLRNVRSDLAALHRFLAPQREVFSKLLNLKHQRWQLEHRMWNLKAEQERLQRGVEELESLRDRTGLLHEEQMHQSTEALNRNMYLLSVISAIFLPLTFFAGLLGMNVGGVPWDGDGEGFVLASLVMVVLGIGMWYLLRRLKVL